MPWFFHEEPGAFVSAAIDKYVYVTLHQSFDGWYKVVYSQLEHGGSSEIQHDIVRGAIETVSSRGGLEIHSIAEVPGGTGLGSSSSFTVGLLKALHPSLTPSQLCNAAIGLELGICKKNIGIQDHLPAVYGGVNLYEVGPLPLAPRITNINCDLQLINDHLLLFDTGLRRKGESGDVITSQEMDRDMVRQLAEFAVPFSKALLQGEMKMCGAVMDAAWHIKRKFIDSDQIDSWYRNAKWEGAWGGKLCGAGGGGFLLFLAPPIAHSRIENSLNLRRIKIKVGVEGSKAICND